jgi:hypothetical protein
MTATSTKPTAPKLTFPTDCPTCSDPAECKRWRPFLEQCSADCERVQAAKAAGRLTFGHPERVAKKVAERWGFTLESLSEYLSEHGMKPPKWWPPKLPEIS